MSSEESSSSQSKSVLAQIWMGVTLVSIVVALYFVYNRVMEAEITAAVGILFPAFQSLKAIESSDKEDDKQWLTYWTVFSLFTFAEFYLSVILKHVPLYFLIKLVFSVYLFQFNGAKWIYDHFLFIAFKRYESDIDRFSNTVGEKVKENINKAKEVMKKQK